MKNSPLMGVDPTGLACFCGTSQDDKIAEAGRQVGVNVAQSETKVDDALLVGAFAVMAAPVAIEVGTAAILNPVAATQALAGLAEGVAPGAGAGALTAIGALEKGIATPYGVAMQADNAAAIAARAEVEAGKTLYRAGTTGKSQTAEGQFWSLEHPLSEGYASRHDIPAENMANFNFIEAATVPPGSPFITRPAPSIGENIGGAIEVVVPSGGVQMKWFSGGP